MSNSLIIFFCIICISICNSQLIVNNTCQNVTIEQNFDLNSYLGLWYEQNRYQASFERNGQCVTAEYTLNPNMTVNVRNFMVNSETGLESVIVGWAELENATSGEGKLLVHFNGATNGSTYWILDTDYSSYSVVWSCANLINQSAQFSWILTREKFPSNETMAAIQNVITQNQLVPEYLTTIHNATYCPI